MVFNRQYEKSNNITLSFYVKYIKEVYTICTGTNVDYHQKSSQI